MKVIEVPGIGPVEAVKRKGNRSIKISIVPPGKVRLSLPYWTPYAAGIAFVQAKADWIKTHLETQSVSPLQPGQAIGKAHHLRFEQSGTGEVITSRVRGGEVVVTYPPSLTWEAASVQAKARQASIRAMRKQAEGLLPARLRRLAELHGFTYKSVAVKQLKRRWGSCDQHKNIVLNLYLMKLPWELIDYVLLHELNHTRHLNHSSAFWDDMALLLPNVPAIRKQMREQQASL